MQRELFLNCPVHQITQTEVLTWIDTRRFDREPHVIAVINANKLWLARCNPRLKRYIQSADLVIPEYAVVWGARRLGLELTPVYGVALVRAFLPFAERIGIRPFFLGARPEVVEALKAHLAAAYPGLRVAGMHHGYLLDRTVEGDLIAQIYRSQADILFVGMGSPRQEDWIDTHKHELNVPVLAGVGGTFDVLAGIKTDAPGWVRGTGFEWLYRLLQEPRQYWRRYCVTNPWFVWQVFRAKLAA